MLQLLSGLTIGLSVGIIVGFVVAVRAIIPKSSFPAV
jgi:hypothetical protein